MRRCQAGDADAGGFDGEDLGDAFVLVQAMEFFTEKRKKRYIDLMIQEAVHFQDVSGTDLTVFEDSVFKQFHGRVSTFCYYGRMPRVCANYD